MIRNAVPQDIPRIAEIIVFGKRTTYRPIFQDDFGSFNEIQVIKVIEQYRQDPSLLKNMLVYDDGILKGIINRIYTDHAVEICDFYVEPFFKGCSIGKQLLEAVIEEAREAGKDKIFLMVLKDNLRAKKFYEHNGFRENGRTGFIEGTSVADVYYELALKD